MPARQSCQTNLCIWSELVTKGTRSGRSDADERSPEAAHKTVVTGQLALRQPLGCRDSHAWQHGRRAVCSLPTRMEPMSPGHRLTVVHAKGGGNQDGVVNFQVGCARVPSAFHVAGQNVLSHQGCPEYAGFSLSARRPRIRYPCWPRFYCIHPAHCRRANAN